jgi:hypothetical protein
MRWISWRRAGTGAGDWLIQESEEFSEMIKTALDRSAERPTPDFEGHRWRYELCIWLMFWT